GCAGAELDVGLGEVAGRDDQGSRQRLGRSVRVGSLAVMTRGRGPSLARGCGGRGCAGVGRAGEEGEGAEAESGAAWAHAPFLARPGVSSPDPARSGTFRHDGGAPMFAKTPKPPYLAVIFTSQHAGGDDDGYAQTADEMISL